MDEGSARWTVCANCAGPIHDADQATCPHCLDALAVRRFRSKEGLEAFREDRRAHGAPVEDAAGSARRPGLALAFAFAATIMLVAGGGILFNGVVSGSLVDVTRSFGQALVPLSIGLGLAVVARRYGGAGS